MDMQMLSVRARNAIKNLGGGSYIAESLEGEISPYAVLLRIPNCGRRTALEIVAYLIADKHSQPAFWSHMGSSAIREINGHLARFGWNGALVEWKPLRLPKSDMPATWMAEIAKLEDRLVRLDDKRRETESALRAARRRLKELEARP